MGQLTLPEILDRYNLKLTVGVEVHVELATSTKMFCSCPNEFGGEPNTRICPVCLGLPGSLPVVNKKAVEFAIAVGLALDCQIASLCLFHRKNYFYPDMPKNYQISQYDLPICYGGHLDVSLSDGSTKRVGIVRAHLEEDTGKSLHLGDTGRIHGAAHSLMDYNRAGVPLLEIVSAPDIDSPELARAYVAELRSILISLGVSDAKMEEGSLRCDANVSVSPADSPELGTKVEIKNMNSLRSLQKALEYEGIRQSEELAAGRQVVQETRHWDEHDSKTHSMRSKEYAEDYRYFPEPDLVPFEPDPAWIEEIRSRLGELPEAKRQRFVRNYDIDRKKAEVLVANPGLDELFEATVSAGAPPAEAANWITVDVLARINETGGDSKHPGVTGKQLASLIGMVREGTLSNKLAKEVLIEVFETGKDPSHIVEERQLVQVSDEATLMEVVRKIVDANPKEADRYRAGEQKLLSFFVGQVMKETRGKANPRLANELIRKVLAAE